MIFIKRVCKLLPLAVSLLVVAALLPALSQAEGDAALATDFSQLSLRDLESLQVFTSASLLPTPLSKAPGTVYTFNRDDFRSFGARRLDELLAFVPGLQLNQYRKRHQTVWARGLVDRFNDKFILMVDGVRRRQLYYGHFSAGDNLPLEYIETVEVILGPASSLYGANAFGGIISVTTRRMTAAPAAEATLELADNDRKKGSFLYNSETLQVFASALNQQAPYREGRKSFIGGEVVQPLDEDYRALDLKLEPIPGLRLSADYSASKTPYLFIPDTQDAYVDDSFLNLAAAWESGDLDTGKLEASLYYQRDRIQEYELEQVTQRLGYRENQDAEKAGLNITGLQRFADHTLATGVSLQYEHALEPALIATTTTVAASCLLPSAVICYLNRVSSISTRPCLCRMCGLCDRIWR